MLGWGVVYYGVMDGRSSQMLPGYLLCLFATVVWGVTFVTSKVLLEALPPLELLFARFLVGYGVLWALSPKLLPWQGWRCEARLALAGATGVTLYFYFENLALLHAGAGLVSVTVCTAPLFTALAACAIGRIRRLKWGYWLGFVLATAGVTLVASRGDLNELKGALSGVIFAILGACTWAVYSLLSQEVPHPAGKLAVTRRIFFWSLLMMVPFGLWQMDSWVWAPLLEMRYLWRLAFLGVLASALCYAAWNLAMSIIGGVRASLFIYLNPVVGVFAAAVVFDEKITALVALGVVLTLLGVVLSSFTAKKE